MEDRIGTSFCRQRDPFRKFVLTRIEELNLPGQLHYPGALDLAREHRLFVETLDTFRPTPVGCGELAGLDSSAGTTLGAVALGRKAGRLSDGEITVYKLWVSPWRIWSLPISLTREPSEKVVEE